MSDGGRRDDERVETRKLTKKKRFQPRTESERESDRLRSVLSTQKKSSQSKKKKTLIKMERQH